MFKQFSNVVKKSKIVIKNDENNPESIDIEANVEPTTIAEEKSYIERRLENGYFNILIFEVCFIMDILFLVTSVLEKFTCLYFGETNYINSNIICIFETLIVVFFIFMYKFSKNTLNSLFETTIFQFLYVCYRLGGTYLLSLFIYSYLTYFEEENVITTTLAPPPPNDIITILTGLNNALG